MPRSMIAGSHCKCFTLTCQIAFQNCCTNLSFLPTMYESSYFSTSFLICGFVSVSDFGHFHRYVMVSHFYFDLVFPDDIWCITYFHILIYYLYIFFSEESVEVIGLFCNWVVYLLSFKSSLYNLDNSLLSDVSYANIFSLSCLLILLTLFFTEQKFLILMKFTLSIFHELYLWCYLWNASP